MEKNSVSQFPVGGFLFAHNGSIGSVNEAKAPIHNS